MVCCIWKKITDKPIPKGSLELQITEAWKLIGDEAMVVPGKENSLRERVIIMRKCLGLNEDLL